VLKNGIRALFQLRVFDPQKLTVMTPAIPGGLRKG
jgi:hypothetical protein